MELSGKLIWADIPKSGVNAKTHEPWTKQNFCIEYHVQTPSMNFTGYLVFAYFVDANTVMPKVGDVVKINYNINARSFVTKETKETVWLNDVRATELEVITPAQQPETPHYAAQQPETPHYAAQPPQEPQFKPTEQNQQALDTLQKAFGTEEKDENLPF